MSISTAVPGRLLEYVNTTISHNGMFDDIECHWLKRRKFELELSFSGI
jgi:hypothetical protein